MVMSLEQRFEILKNQWREETGFHSSVDIIHDNANYQEIIKLGPPVVPLILKELEQNLDHWFEALTQITSCDPIKPEHAGDMDKMARTWLRWGRNNGIIF